MITNQVKLFLISLVAILVVAAVGIVTLRKVPYTNNYCVSSTSLEGNGFSFAGYVNLAKRTVSSLHGSGAATLDTVIVQGVAKVSGSLTAKGGSFGSIIVSGSVTLADTAVLGLTQVIGGLNAQNTTFEGIECTSNRIILTHCVANFIVIQAPEDLEESLTVELIDTSISGDITFKGAVGQVILQNESMVEGQIINGNVI